ncbi:Chain length determinant protein [bacterium A37T11]|nr:Chain length determinant protein [bacterium A37T11]
MNQEISFRSLFFLFRHWIRYLWAQRKYVLLAGIFGALAGLCYSLFNKPQYIATVSFVVDEPKSSGGLGAYAGIAAQFGINLNGVGGGSGLFEGDNIMQFIQSRRMIQKTLLSTVNIHGTRVMLVNRYINLRNLRDKWKKKPELAGLIFRDSSGLFLQDSLLGEFYKEILKKRLHIIKPDRKLNIIALEIGSTDEQFSKAFAEKLLQNVQDFYTHTRVQKSQDNLRSITRQVDSVRRELNAAIAGVASATEANPNPNTAMIRLKVPSQRRTVDVQANTAILTELVKNQELSRMDVQQNTPLIQVIDSPVLPLEKKKTGKLFGMILGGLFGGVLCMIYFTVKKIWVIEMQKN